MASALWGFAFVAQRVGAAHVGPFSFTAVRFALGALVLLPIIWVRDRVRGVPRAKRKAATRAVVLPGIASGVLMTIAVNLQQVAMSDTPAGNAAFITGLYMVFVPVIAAFRGHRSNLATVLGVVASLVGLYLISVNDELTIGRGEWLLILSTIPVMAVVALFVFSLLYIAPGDPAAVIAGDQATPEDVEKIARSGRTD